MVSKPSAAAGGQWSEEVLVGQALTLEQIAEVAYGGARVGVAPEAAGQVRASRRAFEAAVARGEHIYAVTTGVGALAGVPIPPPQADSLQANIVRSHASGVGRPLPADVVRAMMLLRAHGLALGFSGIRPETLEALVALLNARIHPLVPEKGSVGASGDLAPLAHVALTLLGEGRVLASDGTQPAADALRAAGLAPHRLVAREGVALVNGTQMMTAIGALAVLRADRLCRTADVVAGMTAEALVALPQAFDAMLHRARPHAGQQQSAENLRRLLAGSAVARPPERVQDAYALRCIPQVHGAARDGVAYARTVIETEVNSATDNPLIFPDDGRVLSGGNFHGQPVALALDVLAIAVATLGTISERRIERLVNPQLSGLPAFLAPAGGSHSGLMLAQYTAAALVSENKVAAHPASVDSIPTSANQEDHVSMGSIAARKAAQVVEHVEQVVGIEMVCAAQALDLSGVERAAPAVRAAHAAVRRRIARLDDDRILADDLAEAAALVRAGDVVAAAEAAAGGLR